MEVENSIEILSSDETLRNDKDLFLFVQMDYIMTASLQTLDISIGNIQVGYSFFLSFVLKFQCPHSVPCILIC